MSQTELVKAEVFRCFDCKKTFGAEEMKFEKLPTNFQFGDVPPGSEVQACPHCAAVAFFGFDTV